MCAFGRPSGAQWGSQGFFTRVVEDDPGDWVSGPSVRGPLGKWTLGPSRPKVS